MKLLKIEGSQGLFCNAQKEFAPIDKITKEDLLRLVSLSLERDDAQFDEYDANNLKNHAHQIIYKNVFEKLRDLKDRREELKDELGRMYLKEYEKYRNERSLKAAASASE